MKNLEAIYTFTLVAPFVGAFPGVVNAWLVYGPELAQPDEHVHAYFNASTATKPGHLYASMGVHFMEPFAGPTNFSFWTSGVVLFFLPCLGGHALPNTTYGIGMLLALLGAASYSFHRDGSAMGTWQHAADRFGMYTLLIFMACNAPNATFHAWLGKPARPRSKSMLCFNLLALTALVFALSYQDSVDTTPFLLGTGLVTVIFNAITMGLLHTYRAAEQLRRQTPQQEEEEELQPREPRLQPSELGRASVLARVKAFLYANPGTLFLVQAAFSAALMGIPFLCAYASNMHSQGLWQDALRGTSSDGRLLTEAERREARMEHDMYHGFWHIFVSMFCAQCSLILVEGLTGTLTTPIDGMREEWLSAGLIATLSLVLPILVGARARLLSLLVVATLMTALALLLGGYLVARVTFKFRRRMPLPQEAVTPMTVNANQSDTAAPAHTTQLTASPRPVKSSPRPVQSSPRSV